MEEFFVLSYPLLVAVLPNFYRLPRLPPAPNHAPVARRCNRRGLAKPDHRGNIQGDGWRLRRSGHANFPCHGAAVLPPILIQLTFTSHTAFFGTFLGSKKVPSLLVPLVLFFRDCAAADFVVYYKLVCLVRARAAAITLGMISIGENRYAV